MVGLRLFSVIAQAIAVVVTGLIARELGGGRLAQVTAALAVALSALPLFEGTEFQYTTFDYLWWVLIAYFVIRLLKTENPRWWLAIGAVMGMGFETKYTMAFYASGIMGGLVLTRARRYLLSGWFWAGMALTLVIFLPNLIWQFKHDFISLHFLQHIHKRDVGEGRSNGFLLDQFWICTNLVFRSPVDCGIARLPARPPLSHAGVDVSDPAGALHCRQGPRLLPRRSVSHADGDGRSRWASDGCLLVASAGGAMTAVFSLGVLGCGLLSLALIPRAPSGRLRAFALKNNGDLREEIGWDELVKNVATFATRCRPSSNQTSESWWATTASREQSKSSARPITCHYRSAGLIRRGCAAIRFLRRRR